MNKTKKIIKNPKQEVKEKKNINPKIWMVTSIVLLIALVGSLLFDQLYKRTIITIDGDKYYMEDLTYYIYGIESAHDYYSQMFGAQYWDMVIDQSTGSTTRDMAMDEAMNSALYTEILYREAIADGYTLTDEDKEKVETNVASLLDEQLTENVIEKNGFTKEYLTDVLSKTTLVSRYRQDIIDSLDIDDEAIKAEIDYDEYRQYDVEYVFISTETQDEDNKTVAMNDTEKEAVHDKINSLYETALETEDWSELIPEEEKELIYRERSFLERDTVFSEELETIIMAMDNDSISEILEDESGYYFVRMINNNSSESYDNAVQNAITNAEEEGFNEVYNEISDQYEKEVNKKALKRYRMGNITL